MLNRKKVALLFLLIFALLLTSGNQVFGLTINYEYDDLHRLKKVVRSDGKTVEYFYDELGNRTRLLANNPAGAVVAQFTATPLTGIAPLLVQFTDQSAGAVTSRSWDFGDGSTSTEQNPSHIYQHTGTYTVSLTVTGNGTVDTVTTDKYISVQSAIPITTSLSGHVYDADGQGVCGAGISVGEWGRVANVTTGADGGYSIPMIAGSYTISMAYYPNVDMPSCPAGTPTYPAYQSDSVILTVSGNTAQDFNLPQLYTVSGRVLDQSGNGVGNAMVLLMKSMGQFEQPGPAVTTASDGSYTINDVYAGTYSIRFGTDDLNFVGVQGFVVAGNATNQDFHWSADVSLSGHVYDADGHGVCGAQINVGQWGRVANVTTGADGSYSVPMLAGTYAVSMSYDPNMDMSSCPVGAQTYPTYRSDSLTLPVSGNTIEDFNLPQVYTISGRVLDQSGNSVENVALSFVKSNVQFELTGFELPGPTATTAADGSYAIDNVYAGTYDIHFTKDSLSFIGAQEFVVNGSATNKDFNWSANIALSGHVYDAAGQGLCGAQINVGQWGAFARVSTGADGSYSIPMVAGSYSVSMSYDPNMDMPSCPIGASTHLSYESDIVPLTLTGNTVQDFNLPQVYTVSGRVLDKNGSGVENGVISFVKYVTWTMPYGFIVGAAMSADGSYSVNVFAGTYDIRFTKDSLSFIGGRGFIVNGNITNQDFNWGANSGPSESSYVVSNVSFDSPVTNPHYVQLTNDLTVSWDRPADAAMVINYYLKFNTSSDSLTDQELNDDSLTYDFAVAGSSNSQIIAKSFFDAYDSNQLRYLHIKTKYTTITGGSDFSNDVVVGPIRIDNVAPTGTITLDPLSGSGAQITVSIAPSEPIQYFWLSESVTFPGGMGVDGAFDSAVWNLQTQSYGSVPIYAWFQDYAGNRSLSPTATASYDYKAPISIVYSSPQINTGHSSVFTVDGMTTYNWTIMPSADGVAEFSGGGIMVTNAASVTVMGNKAGTFTVTAAPTDGGNSLTTGTVTVLDVTAPETTANPSGGTYGTAQSIILSANEQATIYYTTDGSDPTESSPAYSSPILIAATTTLKFFAKDVAGNVEAVKTQSYTIDVSGPDGSIAISGGITVTKETVITLNLSATDLTGVTQMQFSSDGTTWAEPEAYSAAKAWSLPAVDGIKTIYVKFKDSVGNWSNAFTATITLDTEAPILAISSPSITVTKSDSVIYSVTYSGADTISLSEANVTLNKTGTANGTVAVIGAGNTTRTVTISNMTGDGTLGISIGAGTANDTAGNLAAAIGPSATFTVDNTAPTIATGYTYTEISPPGAVYTYVTDINNNGDVVGVGNSRGFLYSGGSYTEIIPPGWTSSFPNAINDHGYIVGDGDIDGTKKGFLYSGGTYTEIIPPGKPMAFASGINSNGVVVGYSSITGSSYDYRGFLYSGGTYMEIIPPGPEWRSASGRAINSSGSVGGAGISNDTSQWRGFIYSSGGTYTEIIPPEWLSNKWSQSSVADINNSGAVVGAGHNGFGPFDTAFLYSGGTYRLLMPPGWTETRAFAINNSGVIVGQGRNGSKWTSFRYSDGNYTEIIPPGWSSALVNNINDSGVIVGQGFDYNGVYRGFIATPFPIGSPSAAMTKSGPVTYTVTYTGADYVTLVDSNVTLIKTGTANGTATVSGTGNTARTVTISNITGDGTLAISIGSGTASDTVGNLAVAIGPSAPFAVDGTVPVVSVGINQTKNGMFPQTGTATDANTLTYAWTKQAGPGTLTFDAAAALSTTISASLDGIYTIRFTATDAAGNSSYSDMTLVWDTTSPVTTVSPPEGTYDLSQSVTLSANEQAVIYYTTDGSDPTESSSVYSAPIPLAVTTTLKFFAKDLAGNYEAVKTAVYSIVHIAKGDINGDGSVDLTDAVLAMQIFSQIIPTQPIYKYADVDGDGRIGLQDVVYVLQKIAGMREQPTGGTGSPF